MGLTNGEMVVLEGKQFDTPPVLGRQQKAQQQLVF